MSFSKIKMIPLVSKLGDYLGLAFQHYVAMKATGVEITSENLAGFIEEKMAEWDPELNGNKLLDPNTRKAASRFVAGIALNLAK